MGRGALAALLEMGDEASEGVKRRREADLEEDEPAAAESAIIGGGSWESRLNRTAGEVSGEGDG